jgi:hypothetical protein
LFLSRITPTIPLTIAASGAMQNGYSCPTAETSSPHPGLKTT